MEPCPMCLGTWYMSGMAVLHYAARDPYAGSTDLLNTTWYMRKKGKKAFGPEDSWLEDILIGLLVETEIRRKGFFHRGVKERWKPVLPRGIKMGEEMSADTPLSNLRADNAPVGEAFLYLASNYV
jgi:hypothetical protein